MMRKTSLILLSAATGAALTLFVTQPRAVFMGSSARAATSDTYRQLNLFGDVFERVRSDYVEKPDNSKLVESAISGMLAGLDPHSSYMDAKSFRDMQVQTRGEFGGLGIEVTMEDGLIKVVSPIDDTPASKAGIMANDIITNLDDEAVQGLTLNQAVEKMRGPVNTKIRLKIIRKGQDNPIDVTLVRDNIRVRSVRARVEGDDIAYIRITTFNEQTTEGLKREIGNLSNQLGDKLKGYIIDLRNNPGGLLEEAVTVSDTFLERGEIVSTRGRNAEETQRRAAHPGDLTKGKPVIVLINGGSASASEIVAGALQDHKRATLVGTRSFGKGSVQTIIPLGSGNGALRLTTARYYTPSGKSIQAKGIVPDIEVLQDVPDELKSRTDTKGEASLRGHLKNDGDEKTGSQSYVPPDAKDDKALKTAGRPAAWHQVHGRNDDTAGTGNRRQGRDRQACQQGGELIHPTSGFREKGGLRAALFVAGAKSPRQASIRGLLPGAKGLESGPSWYRRHIDSGRFMAETADELSTPLGQKAARKKRRFRLPFTAMQALAVLLGLFLVAFAGIALFTDNPLGGEPVAHIALHKAPADEKPAMAAAGHCRAGRESRAQTGAGGREQDRHHHRRLQRQAPGRRDRRRSRRQGRGGCRARDDGRHRSAPAGEIALRHDSGGRRRTEAVHGLCGRRRPRQGGQDARGCHRRRRPRRRRRQDHRRHHEAAAGRDAGVHALRGGSDQARRTGAGAAPRNPAADPDGAVRLSR